MFHHRSIIACLRLHLLHTRPGLRVRKGHEATRPEELNRLPEPKSGCHEAVPSKLTRGVDFGSR
eukprot:2217742-Amphidinium_carterae.1